MSENKSKKNPLWDSVMKTDGEAITQVLETSKQAIDVWQLDPESETWAMVSEVTLTLSRLHPVEVGNFIAERLNAELAKTHERVRLSLRPEIVEMRSANAGSKAKRLFRTAIVTVKIV